MYHKVSNIGCFWTFSVKLKENDFYRKYRLLGGPAEIYLLQFNFTDRTKLMIFFHLQRLGAERHRTRFLNY